MVFMCDDSEGMMCDDSEGMMCNDSEGMMCLYTVSEESNRSVSDLYSLRTRSFSLFVLEASLLRIRDLTFSYIDPVILIGHTNILSLIS